MSVGREGFNVAKVARVAAREFASTALTKGFIFGALVLPAVLLALIPLIVVLGAAAKPPAPKGKILVIDRSGEVARTLAERLSVESIRERRQEMARRAGDLATGALGGFGKQIAGSTEQALEQIPVPEFVIEDLGAGADAEGAKERIRAQLGQEVAEAERVLALIEVDADAVVKRAEGAADGEGGSAGFGAWQPFFRPKLNSEAVDEIEAAVDWSIRERRYVVAGVDRESIRELDTIGRRDAQEITAEGERDDTSEVATLVIPFAAMILLLVATFTGGQYLLTTTIEEKSSRVVEVLLSAVSPLELMTGKILGQMGVGLSLLVIYNAIGIVALVAFSIGGMISWQLLASFVVFFVLAYFMFAAMMAAIGAAVNDLREAQSLMTPVMLVSMVPYFLFMPVIRAPNSGLSVALSFVPPISPFIMIMRLATPETIPAWQVAGAVVVNLVGVLFLLWFAAKVFRVGLLMYGKPPNFRTLVKWVRMA